MPLKLRPALPSDFPTLATWVPDAEACRRWAGPGLPFPFAPEDLAALLESGTRSSLVLEEDGRPVGFGQHWVRAEAQVHLGRILVAPGARGRGLGRELVRRLTAEALRTTGAGVVTLRVYRANAAALALYRGLGFSEPPEASTADPQFLVAPAAAFATPPHRIRPEQPGDRAAIHALNAAAFGSPAEGDLVDALRRDARPLVSLVAETEGGIRGHILFSPVTLEGHPDLRLMGLAPMAVAPGHQRRGLGSALVRAGLAACGALACDGVVVLGHPDYYPRFGFTPAAGFGLRCEYDAPEEAFLALELVPGCLQGRTGTLRYHPAFASLPEPPMPLPGPKALVTAWIEAFNRADAEALTAMYHPDAVNHQVAEAPVQGRDAIRAMFAREFAAAEMVCIPENLFEDGEWAILEWRDPLGLRGCGFFRVVEGRIAFQRGYWDKLSFLRQHGLPVPGA